MNELREEVLDYQEKTEEKPSYQSQRFDRIIEEGSYKDRMMNREKKLEPAQSQAEVPKRRKRWDVEDLSSKKPKSSEWDQSETGSFQGDTPKLSIPETPKQSKWDETPRNTNWEETPKAKASETPKGNDYERRNYYQSDEELNSSLPVKGYTIIEAPVDYKPIMTPHRKLSETPMSERQFEFQQADQKVPGVAGALLSGEDVQFFGKLMDSRNDMDLSIEELKERKIMKLLLKIKSGTAQARKLAMRQIIDSAHILGAGPLFDHILPLLMSPSLDDQERHLLVKVIDRLLFKLDELVRPYCHKILVVIEPMLIDEDYYARTEGREIISNLAKACGLATMISVMRPDIDHTDEYVRNTTSRAFAVVASALGIATIIPFLKAVCKSRKSWQARHTGIKIVQQIAVLLGPAVLPHLSQLVMAIKDGLLDEQTKVRTITGLALAALAESSSPYGADSFVPVRDILFTSVEKIKGKNLAAYLKAIGFMIPLFDPRTANIYTRKVMPRIVDEFRTPDTEMKKIVLKVVEQCCSTEGVGATFIKSEILPKYFKYFWVRAMSYDRRNYKQLVDTTVKISEIVGVSAIIDEIVGDLKDESEPFRRMVCETIDSIIKSLGSADLSDRMVEVIIDGLLFAFQEQVSEEVALINAFGTVVNSFGIRVKQYLPQIVSTILWRLNNKSARVRQQAADLISKIAPAMSKCGEDNLLSQLGVVLYEYLGEEYPEVLGSILNGLKAIVNCIGMQAMAPPIKDLLPRLTPILKNRHEKVQEHCIELVGRIADRGAEFVSAREWMRICFELLDTLKAVRKTIRRAAINAFGYIAKAIGPQDVLSTLLNNLKVQDRQNRVCTTIAIAIVAETCAPFTVLPALMNEYRVPEMNVQNGCLKALSFLFEYIGEMGKDYVWPVSVLLEDALMDRDLIHRQIASSTVKHLALGVVGMGHEDALIHLLNLVWPNIFEVLFIKKAIPACN